MKINVKNNKVTFEKVCKKCGCLDNKIYPGKGPHHAEIRCIGCASHNGWLSKYDKDIADLYESGLFAPDTIAQLIIKAEDEILECQSSGDKYKQQSLMTYKEKMLGLLTNMPTVDARHWLNLARNEIRA